MSNDLYAEKLRLVTGSMVYTISAVATVTPTGVTEPSGSIIRTQDGEIWVNTDGGTTWVKTGPGAFTDLSGTIDARFVNLTGSLISGLANTYSTLSAGSSASISGLSGTVNARFLNVTGSLISSIASTNSSLKAGVTASLQSYYTTILAGTSASDSTYYTTLQTGVSASDAAVQVSLKAGSTASIAAQYTMMIAGTSASDVAVQTSLKAGVTASFISWGEYTQIKGTPTVANDGLTLGFSAPNGLIAVKNTSGSPAANLYLQTTDTGGTVNNVLELGYDKSVTATGNILAQGALTGTSLLLTSSAGAMSFHDKLNDAGIYDAGSHTYNYMSIDPSTQFNVWAGSGDTTFAILNSGGGKVNLSTTGDFNAGGSVTGSGGAILGSSDTTNTTVRGTFGITLTSADSSPVATFTNDVSAWRTGIDGSDNDAWQITENGVSRWMVIAKTTGKATFNGELAVVGSLTGSGDATFSRNVGIGTGATLARLYMVGAGTSTTLGSHDSNSTLRIANSDSTLNNFESVVFGSTAKAAIEVQNFNKANNYSNIHFAARGTDGWQTRLFVSASGRVGIGTTTPSEKLHVVGEVQLQGAGGTLTSHFNYNGGANQDTYIRAGQAAGSVYIGDVNAFVYLGKSDLSSDVRAYGSFIANGTDYSSIINWNGSTQQDTYIRAGKLGGAITIGDVNTGSIAIGTTSNSTSVRGNFLANTDGGTSQINGNTTFVLNTLVQGSITGSGDATFGRNLQAGGVTGSSGVKIGGSTSANSELLGQITINGTVGGGGFVLGHVGGIPKWTVLSGAGGISGGGTQNTVPIWSGEYTLTDSKLVYNAGGLEVTNAGLTVSITGSDTLPTAYNISHLGGGSAIANDTLGIDMLWTSIKLDTTAADRAAYGLRVQAHSSRSNGANNNSTYGIHVDAFNDTDATRNWAIYSDYGNVRLNAASPSNYSTDVGVLYGRSYAYLNYLGVGSTEVHGALSVASGTTTSNPNGSPFTANGSVTGTLDASFDRNINAGGSMTASLDLRVGRYLNANTIINSVSVQGSLTASDGIQADGNINTSNSVKALAGSVDSFSYNVYSGGTLTPGRLFLKRQIFTTSSVYAPTQGTKAILVRMVGGGGGGGGGTNGGNASAGGGGASGEYIEKWFSSLTSTTGSVSIGSAGTGGNEGDGSAGGDTSFGVNQVTWVAQGGNGGLRAVYAGSPIPAVGGTVQTSVSTGDVNYQEAGKWGMMSTTNPRYGGSGGSNPLGSGGGEVFSQGNGAAPRGYGGGGGGCFDVNALDASGANGGQGLVIIDEFG